jgi:hypothetical protein
MRAMAWDGDGVQRGGCQNDSIVVVGDMLRDGHESCHGYYIYVVSKRPCVSLLGHTTNVVKSKVSTIACQMT